MAPLGRAPAITLQPQGPHLYAPTPSVRAVRARETCCCFLFSKNPMFLKFLEDTILRKSRAVYGNIPKNTRQHDNTFSSPSQFGLVPHAWRQARFCSLFACLSENLQTDPTWMSLWIVNSSRKAYCYCLMATIFSCNLFE